MDLQSSISLVMVNDGLDGGSGAPYFIQSNYDEILRFVSIAPGTKTTQVSASPEILSFQVFENATSSTAEVLQNNWKGYYSLNRIDFEEIPSEFISYGADFKSVEFNFANFLNHDKDGEIYKRWESESDSFPMFKFVFLKNNLPVVSKLITIKNGMSSDLAKLNICANGIYQSVLDASLNFSASGLELDGANFTIMGSQYIQQEKLDQAKFDELKENLYYLDANFDYIKAGSEFEDSKVYFLLEKKPVLAADEDGNLVMTGIVNATGGTFTGVINAQGGNFSGTINADTGSIGGFTIEGSELTSQDENHKIKLNGKTGSIVAGKIELGEATLQNELTIGNASLRNPGEGEDRKFLEAGNIKLYDDGKISLGSLELYGGSGNSDGYIRTNANVGNGAWEINEDGSARFDNITVNEAKIRNSVLEVDTVQTVGSRMVFKESLVGYSNDNKEANEHIVYLEGWMDQMPGKEEWIWNGSYFFQVEEIWETQYYVLEQGEYQQVEKGSSFNPENTYYINTGENYDPISFPTFCTKVKINSPAIISLAPRQVFSRVGKKEESIISILGANSVQYDSTDFAIGNTLTIAKIDEDKNKNEKITFSPQLVLGNLKNFDSRMEGYGLYCDNVHLNGTLSTGGYSAGISTSNSAFFTQDTEDKSSIIFWGGATDQNNISAAPFQVTEEGTLYAQKAIIIGKITGSEIYGSTIYGAELRGWKGNESAALSIYDTSSGIEFKSVLDEDTILTLFKINSSGLAIGNDNFIQIQGSGVSFKGESFSTDNIDMTNCIYFTKEIETNIQNYPHIGRSKTAIHIGYGNGEDDGIRVSESQIKANSVFCAHDGVVLMNNDSYRLEYRRNQAGDYDLYVY